MDNLMLADQKASKGKSSQYGVITHAKNREANLATIYHDLITKTYTTSKYKTSVVMEPKERLVHKLPFYPDRIVHHAIMNVLEPVFTNLFTADTYSCIKGRGIHGLANNLRKALDQDRPGTEYCLKLDIRKFYASIDHDILKQLLRRKFKDNDLLWLLDDIIDSADGVPIGNYLSQYFANFYLTYFDHWIKEVKGVKYYFRYADDIVICSDNKVFLHNLLTDIKEYLSTELKLDVKGNHQVFPVSVRGIDVVGYRFFHTHTLLRKSIKKNFARKVARNGSHSTISAYYGWTKHADCKHLFKTLLTYEQLSRFRDRKQTGKIRRRKNKHLQNTGQADSGSLFQDRRFQKEQRPGREVPYHAD
jgi:retron-type reverse transcriptase